MQAGVESFVSDLSGSNLHQLALMTSIRMSLTEDDNRIEYEQNNEIKLDLLKNTELMEIIHKILGFQSSTEELYFLKHEAIWVLISFSLGSEEIVQHLLQEVEEGDSYSNLLAKINNIIKDDLSTVG